MRRIRIIPFVIVISLIISVPLFARGQEDTVSPMQNRVETNRIVQVGSAAFIVQNALFLFPEARERVIAASDGNQGNGSYLGDLKPVVSSIEILPRTANTETILSLHPDVVVMKNSIRERMGVPLEEVGVNTFYLNLETPEAWTEDLIRLGTLFNNPERAAEIQSLFSKRIAAVEEPIAGLSDSDRPKTLLLYWSVKDGVSAVNVPPRGWMQTRMVEMAGGNPVWGNVNSGPRWMRVNLEQIAAWDPDTIVVAAYHIQASEAVDEIMADPTWAELRAVREGRVLDFPVDYHSWDQPDVRWLLGLAWLASELHPELYPNIDMEAEARRFYSDFYNLDDTAFDSMIAPRLNGLD